jgi:ATP-binding cassette, subfamily C, bacterial
MFKDKFNAIKYFVTLYPYRVTFAVIALFISGLAEAFSFAALIPLIGMALNDSATVPDANFLQDAVNSLFMIAGADASIGGILLLITFLMTLKSFLTFYTMKEVGYICADVEADFRYKISKSLFNAEWKYLLINKTGDFSSAVSTQVENATNIFRASSLVISGIFQVSLFLIMSLTLSVMVTVSAVILGALIMLVLSRYTKLAEKSSLKLTKHQGILLSVLIDGLKSFKIYKAMGMEKRLISYLNKDILQLSSMRKKIVYSSAILNNFQEPIQIIVISLGVYFLSVYWLGDIEQLIVLVLLFHRSGQRLGLLQVYYQQIATAMPSFSFVNNVIQASKEYKEEVELGLQATMCQNINFSNVGYSYKEQQVLKGVSFNVNFGDFVSIVGESGSGKTTLLDMLLTFNKPDYGKISFDGVTINKFSKKSLRSIIGYVSQETTLFHDSIRNNITFGDESVNDDLINNSLKMAGALSFVNNLPDGLDFIVGEHGGRLSGGQRQRIGIARALLNNPKILILDEPTSALDKHSEKKVLDTLNLLHGKVTIIAVSHQKKFIDMADKVYLLDSGQITQVDR